METLFSVAESRRLPRLKPFTLVLLLSTVLVCAAYPGSRLSVYAAFAVIALTVAVLLCFSKSVFCVLVIAVPAALIWLYTGSAAYAALLCSAVVTIGIGAFLIRTTRSPWLLLLVPGAYFAAFAVGGRPIAALWSLVFFPAAYVLARSVSGKNGRLSVICRVSATLALTGVAAATVCLTVANGSFGFTMLRDAFNGISERITSYYITQYAALSAKYTEMGIDISQLALTAADAKLNAAAVFGIVPAIAVIAVNAASFISYQLTLSLFGKSGQTGFLTDRSLSFSMSWVSALIFIIAYFVMFITSYSGSATASLIAENIYLILLPGLVFTGVLVILGRGSRGKRHIFWLILVIMLAFISPNLALAVAAFIGCGAIISSNLRKLFPPPEES